MFLLRLLAPQGVANNPPTNSPCLQRAKRFVKKTSSKTSVGWLLSSLSMFSTMKPLWRSLVGRHHKSDSGPPKSRGILGCTMPCVTSSLRRGGSQARGLRLFVRQRSPQDACSSLPSIEQILASDSKTCPQLKQKPEEPQPSN